jgi:ABC-type amino acid transport substrate-binding protein
MKITSCLSALLGLATFALTGAATAGGHSGLELTDPEKAFIRDNPTLTLCVDPNWLPYEGLSADGKHVGLLAEYMLEFQTRTGLVFEIVQTRSWEQSWQLATEGKCDLISGLNRTQDRERYVSFTKEYVNEPSVLVTRNGGINRLEDMSGKRLAVVQGYSLDEKIALDYPGVIRVYVPKLDDGLAKVAAGEVDAVAGSMFLMQSKLASGAYPSLQIAGETGYLNLIRVGVRRDRYRGYTIMNKAVRSLTYSDHKAIRERYKASMTGSG